MSTLRTYKQLPVHIVEDHNDVLYHILRAVGSKHLPFASNLIIHFDSHPDLLLPADLKASQVLDVPLMLEKLSIENWLLVAAYAGQISTIVWVKPPWSHQIEKGTHTFFIGKQKGTEDIKVSSSLMYFVGEMLYCPVSELEDSKEIKLKVVTLEKESMDTIVKDLRSMANDHKEFYVLDIDLDFFTTMNPFVSMHEKVNMYNRLKTAYSFEYEHSEDEEALKAQLQKRHIQITTLKNIFSHVEDLKEPEAILKEVASICESITEKEQRECIVQLITDLTSTYKEKVDWGLIHDAGCTWDDEKHQLPHHISSQEEIDSLAQMFRQLVSGLPTPTVVTIARSSLDDYCPPNQVDSVQEIVCQFLRKSYDVECKRHYEEES